MLYPIVNPLGSVHYSSKILVPSLTDTQVMCSLVFPSLDDIYCIEVQNLDISGQKLGIEDQNLGIRGQKFGIKSQN